MAEHPFLSEFRIYLLPLAGLGGLPGTQRLKRLHPRSLPFPSRPPPPWGWENCVCASRDNSLKVSLFARWSARLPAPLHVPRHPSCQPTGSPSVPFLNFSGLFATCTDCHVLFLPLKCRSRLLGLAGSCPLVRSRLQLSLSSCSSPTTPRQS